MKRVSAPLPLALRLRGEASEAGDGRTAPSPTRTTGETGEPERRRLIWPVLVCCLVLSALTLLFPSTPTYDPWAWILWRRGITRLDLTTTGGP